MMSRRLVAIAAGVFVMVALALAGFVTGSSASVSRAGAVTGSQTFTDAAGDSSGAPDITQVVISDFAATGMIQVAVTASGMQPATTGFFVFLDTDMNASTGSASGSEYSLSVDQDAQGKFWWDFTRWNGSDWQEVTLSATMNFSRSGDVFTFTLGKADLGGTTAPGGTFYVGSYLDDASGNTTADDFAPDSGKWVYQFSAPSTTTTTPAAAVKPVIDPPTTTPAKAVAGKRFTVAFPVTRDDNGAPLTSGRMICDPSVTGKVITHAESFTGGTAKLSFTVPKTAKGKLLKVKLTIKVGNKSTTRIATFHIS